VSVLKTLFEEVFPKLRGETVHFKFGFAVFRKDRLVLYTSSRADKVLKHAFQRRKDWFCDERMPFTREVCKGVFYAPEPRLRGGILQGDFAAYSAGQRLIVPDEDLLKEVRDTRPEDDYEDSLKRKNALMKLLLDSFTRKKALRLIGCWSSSPVFRVNGVPIHRSFYLLESGDVVQLLNYSKAQLFAVVVDEMRCLLKYSFDGVTFSDWAAAVPVRGVSSFGGEVTSCVASVVKEHPEKSDEELARLARERLNSEFQGFGL